jgi:hypothetical protein
MTQTLMQLVLSLIYYRQDAWNYQDVQSSKGHASRGGGSLFELDGDRYHEHVS